MRFFNAVLASLTAGLVAAALTLTAASWIGPPAPSEAGLLARADAVAPPSR